MARRCAVKTFWMLAALALATGVAATAQPQVASHYYTELYQFPQGGFPVSATMDLTLRPDGTLIGYYRPTDGGVQPVTGSVSGAHISLSIGGGRGGLQVTGVLENGKIDARAFRSFGSQVYSFVGRPIPNDQTLPHEP